jgi:uncharacterized protein YjiS (DUF1127 family)
MHKAQTCHAERTLVSGPPPAYLSTIEAGQRVPVQTIRSGKGKGADMNLVRSYGNWRRYRETCSELNKLTSRELSDLGIARSDIPRLAREATR